MLADHFTKPLQSKPFYKFCSKLMNIPEETEMDDIGWNDLTEKKPMTEELHSGDKHLIPHECVGISKPKGRTWKSNPEKIRSDDVSKVEPDGIQTSWRQRYKNKSALLQPLKGNRKNCTCVGKYAPRRAMCYTMIQ